jgi:hypothetical protein
MGKSVTSVMDTETDTINGDIGETRTVSLLHRIWHQILADIWSSLADWPVSVIRE